MKIKLLWQFIVSILGIAGFGLPLIYLYLAVGFTWPLVLLTLAGFGISIFVWVILRWLNKKTERQSAVSLLISFIAGGALIFGLGLFQKVPLGEEYLAFLPVMVYSIFFGACVIWFFSAWLRRSDS
ncbi:hypothetical protein ACFL2B_01275 [Patescibacteria group bacterium]